ncbi:MAG TPA: TIGR03617 family F420-dependent LLM class oxidoreductase [Jatrophihabitantaceae bacterium]|nr:TIGR03617 family F420-dependent LLM class oxidoreductase [Jatrophihabitantaceae bacterium]
MPADPPHLAIDVSFHGPQSEIAAIARDLEQETSSSGLFTPEGAHDSFVSLALAAQSTTRIPLGTGVAIAFARTPMSLAYSAYDVHRLSGGRLILGLGTQIKPHIAYRFGMPWSRPAARMREYVSALRAIWHSWQTGDALDFRGEFYTHTLMPPLFSPGAIDFPSPRIWLAGVGPKMVEVAGAVADGFVAHPLISRSYLETELIPQVHASRASAGRDDEQFDMASMVMVVTGRTEEQLRAAIAGTRRQIGFYASTPAYLPVLEHHGWAALHADARALTKAGRWAELGDLIDDDVLHTLAVVAELPDAGTALRDRFGDLLDRAILSLPYAADNQLGMDIART